MRWESVGWDEARTVWARKYGLRARGENRWIFVLYSRSRSR